MILWKERGSRVGRFSCVEARGGGGRRGVAVFPLCPEERTGEGGVPRSCRHGFSNVSPLTHSRMKSFETYPFLAMLDLTVSLTSWSTNRLLKDSVSTSCVLVSDSLLATEQQV